MGESRIPGNHKQSGISWQDIIRITLEQKNKKVLHIRSVEILLKNKLSWKIVGKVNNYVKSILKWKLVLNKRHKNANLDRERILLLCVTSNLRLRLCVFEWVNACTYRLSRNVCLTFMCTWSCGYCKTL